MDITRLPSQDPAVPVHLHPLTIFVIADHITRSQYLHHLYHAAAATASGGANPYSSYAFVMGLLMGSTGASSGRSASNHPHKATGASGQRRRDAAAPTAGGVDIVGGYPLFYQEAVLREVNLEAGASRVELQPLPPTRGALLAAGAGLACAPPRPALLAEGEDDGGSDEDPNALRTGPASPFFAVADGAAGDLRVSTQQLTRNYYVQHLDAVNTTTQAVLLNRIYAQTGVIGFYFLHRQDPAQASADLADLLYMISSFVGNFLLVWYPHLKAERMMALVMHTTAASESSTQPQQPREEPQMSLFECTVQAAATEESATSPSLDEACRRLAAEGGAVLPLHRLGATDGPHESLCIRKVKYALEAGEMEHLCFNALQDITVQRIHNNRPERGGRAAQAAAATASAKQVITQRLREPVRAIKLLRERLALLLCYLETIKRQVRNESHEEPPLRREDYEILRSIGTVCAQLPCEPPSYPHHTFNDCALLPPPPPVPGIPTTNVVGREAERNLLTELLSLQTAAVAELTTLVAGHRATIGNFQHMTQASKDKTAAEMRERARRRERNAHSGMHMGISMDLDFERSFRDRSRHGGIMGGKKYRSKFMDD